MHKIGKLYAILTPYYNAQTNQNSFKKRSALILGKADNEDYVVLPLSTITHQNKRDMNFDMEIIPANYPLLRQPKTSYIRTHKQQIVHNADLYIVISDLKTEYPELFLNILSKVEEFQQKIISEAI